MNSTLMHTTCIAILVEADTAQITELIKVLLALFNLLFTVWSWITPVVIFAADIVEAASFTAKMLTIGFNSLLLGLGVTR